MLLRRRQQVLVLDALDHRSTIRGQHVWHEHCVERKDAGLNGRDLTRDPVPQDRVDGDMPLLERSLFVLDTRDSTAWWGLP